MARLPFRSRREQPQPAAAPPTAVRRVLPPPSQLRRERRALLRVREERIRDLGGLVLEMYRRDQFREDLLLERCVDLAALDERIQELDALLLAASSRRRPPAARCECGAPIAWGARFCASCGRPVGGTAPSTNGAPEPTPE
jgi:uncharacterized protein YjiS (DUF1127 family)